MTIALEISAEEIAFQSEWREKIASEMFHVASLLTEPVCKTHEFYRRISIVDVLNPISSRVANCGRKFFLGLGMVGSGTVGAVTALPGIAIRYLAASLQRVPFIHSKQGDEGKILPANGTFTVLTWNICAIGAGYAIEAGGVMPWHFRIEKIVDRIIEKNADVICLNEVFDVRTARYICERLKEKGYSDFYYNIGPKAFGVSSGLLVASRYKIEKPEFTLFPPEMTVGKTKYTAKGIFGFDLTSQGKSFARVFTTHLQNSPAPAFPENEKEAREKQMWMIVEKTNAIRDRCVLVVGDLNADEEEYEASPLRHRFRRGDHFHGEKTWGGDGFCARLVDQQVSGPRTLDYALLGHGRVNAAIHTTLIETDFDGEVFRKEALSDHRGLFSRVTIHR